VSNKSGQIVGAKVVSMSMSGMSEPIITTDDIHKNDSYCFEIQLILDSGVTLQFTGGNVYDDPCVDVEVKK
jgi:hypothetical protein